MVELPSKRVTAADRAAQDGLIDDRGNSGRIGALQPFAEGPLTVHAQPDAGEHPLSSWLRRMVNAVIARAYSSVCNSPGMNSNCEVLMTEASYS